MAQELIVSVSGVRGVIGEALTPQVACDFGGAFAAMLAAGADGDGPLRVAVGRDSRPSGPMLQHAITAGLLAAGIEVIDLGLISTPGAALLTRQLEADGGVVVTASHNPAPYNGLKFLQGRGMALTADAAARLKDRWSRRDFRRVDAASIPREHRQQKTHGRHMEAASALVDATGIAARRFKVVLDSVNGAGCVVTPMLLGFLGCETAHLNGEATGRFGRGAEPIAENLGDLCEAVRKHGAAVGFAQDPDADRLALVDERGRFLGEEYTLALTAAQVLRHRRGPVAANLSTSRMIDDVAAAAGVAVVRAPTGEANVAEAMLRDACVYGGEGNGGVIDPRVVYVRDSLVGIVYVLAALAETGKTLSELAAELPRYEMLKTKLPCESEAVPGMLERVRNAFAGRDGARLDEQDGLRVDLPEAWFNVRGSNTEPIVRITAEARDGETARKLVDEVRGLVTEA